MFSENQIHPYRIPLEVNSMVNFQRHGKENGFSKVQVCFLKQNHSVRIESDVDDYSHTLNDSVEP